MRASTMLHFVATVAYVPEIWSVRMEFIVNNFLLLKIKPTSRCENLSSCRSEYSRLIVENDYLNFSRYSGYILHDSWAGLQSSGMKFLQDFMYQKLLKLVHFDLSYLKIKRVTFFGLQCVYNKK